MFVMTGDSTFRAGKRHPYTPNMSQKKGDPLSARVVIQFGNAKNVGVCAVLFKLTYLAFWRKLVPYFFTY